MEEKSRYSEVITYKRMIRFSLIAPVAGLLSGMWGNIQFFAVCIHNNEDYGTNQYYYFKRKSIRKR